MNLVLGITKPLQQVKYILNHLLTSISRKRKNLTSFPKWHFNQNIHQKLTLKRYS
jgi:hypothetical protein